MSSTTENLKNINFMSQERYNNLSEIKSDELYAVKIQDIRKRVLDYYGTCDTAAGTQTKVVTCSDFTLETGVCIRVKFTNAQSYNGVPKLNVNGTGAIEVKFRGTSNAGRYYWRDGEVYTFTYDGTYWIMNEAGLADTTYYGRTKLQTSNTSTSTTLALTPASVNNLVQNMIEPYAVYSSSSTYAVGDKVRYSDNAWRCNTAITTAEAWTSSHWTKIDPIQTQLDAKAADSNTVHKSGNETIAGTKTFSSTISGSVSGNAGTVTNGVYTTGNQTVGGTKTFSSSPVISGASQSLIIKNTNITRNTAPSAAVNVIYINGKDSADKNTWGIYHTWGTNKAAFTRLICYKGTTTDNTWDSIGVGYDASGNSYTYAPTPAASSNTTQIATTAWVNTKLSSAMIPDYTNPKTASTSYTPTANGTLHASLTAGGAWVQIACGNEVLARAQTTDSTSGTEAVWIIAKKGQTYTVTGKSTPTVKFYPFL